MSNIIARAGKAIAQNKEEVKVIMDKHKVPYGDGKMFSLIKAVFTGIKAGNKELAQDIAALVTEKEKNPKSTRNPFSAREKNLLTEIKAKIAARIESVKAKKPSNADGDSELVMATADELFKTVSTGDVDSLSMEANKGASDMKPVLYGVGAVLLIVAIFWALNKYKVI